MTDLAQGLGHLEDPKHQEVTRSAARVREACAGAGKPLGIGVLTPEDVTKAVSSGSTYLMTTTFALLGATTDELKRAMRGTVTQNGQRPPEARAEESVRENVGD
jgi:2-keto-3-deoxy-L-rhamnonate aldolase RhmA